MHGDFWWISYGFEIGWPYSGVTSIIGRAYGSVKVERESNAWVYWV
jgi:hypothetical protein